MPFNPYATKVLDPVYHERLVSDLDHVAEVAGIPRAFIWTPTDAYCTEEEIEWVKTFPKHEATATYGLCYTGQSDIPIRTRMGSIAAMFLRNYKDARVRGVQDLISKDVEVPDCTVLLIPDFIEASVKNPDWINAKMGSIILSRFKSGKSTIIAVSSMSQLELRCGSSIEAHIKTHFKVISV